MKLIYFWVPPTARRQAAWPVNLPAENIHPVGSGGRDKVQACGAKIFIVSAHCVLLGNDSGRGGVFMFFLGVLYRSETWCMVEPDGVRHQRVFQFQF